MPEETHICEKEGVLAKLEAGQEHQSETSARIEANLKSLADSVRKGQENQSTRELEHMTQFKELQAAINTQNEMLKSNQASQNETKAAVDSLKQRITGVEASQKETRAILDSIQEIFKDHGERLLKLERIIVRVVWIAGSVWGAYIGITKMGDIRDWILGTPRDRKSVV